ncbi:MAG: FAD:protein FMN transferase [Dialister pneumosintes]
MKNNQSITTIYGGIMGTFLKVTQYGKPHKKVADKVSDYFQKIEHVCSRFLENSEISCINRNAGVGPVSVSPLCEEICLEAWKETKFTEGAFNPTIGLLSSLWNIGQDNAGFPGEEAIKAATKLVDIEALEIKNHSVFLKKKGMSIDLGGIAKEFALFQSACLAEEKYHEGMLIDAGGDIATVGNKSDGSPWCIGIQHPRKRNTLLATIMLDNWDMIQTSGDYRRFIKHKDTFYSHIFHTVKDEIPLISATLIFKRNKIIAPFGGAACLASGLNKVKQWLVKVPEIEAVLITYDGRAFITKGVQNYIHFLDDTIELQML